MSDTTNNALPTPAAGTYVDPNAPGWFGSGQGLTAAVINPQTQALLGLAGGLAQAAMPSRMKIPLGVAISDGANGISDGVKNSMALQAAYNQNYGSAMSLDQQRAQQPGLMAMYGGGSGMPFGVPRPPAGGQGSGQPAGGVMASPAAGPGGNSQPVLTPAQAGFLGRVAMSRGQDKAAASLFELEQQMAGGTGYQAQNDGTSRYTPGGSADPNVQFRNKAAEGWGGVQPHLAENGLQLGPNNTIVPMQGYIGAKAAQAGAEAQAGVGPALAKMGLQQNADGTIVPTPGFQAATSGNAAATTAGTEAAKAPYADPVQYDAEGPNGQVSHFVVPRTTYAAGAGSGNAPLQPMPAATWAGKVSGIESGNNPAATNPGSTAGGSAQFTTPTWNAFLQSQHPELANTANPGALKSNPALTQEATVWLARQNAGVLAQTGAPINASTLALAHHVGGQGASDILRAPPNMPLSAIPSLQGALGTIPGTNRPLNPDMMNQTAGSMRGNYLMRFGTAPVDLSAGSSGAPAQGPLGGVPGAPIMTEEQKALSAQYGAQAGAVMQAAAKAPSIMQRIDVISNAAQNFQPSAWGADRLGAARNLAAAFQQVGLPVPAMLANGAAGGETINKEGMALATDLTRSLGSREAASVLNSVRSIMPNTAMSNGGFQAVSQIVKQGAQRDLDLGQFQESWLQSHPSTAGMQQAFNAQNPPEAYASRVIPFPQPRSGALLPNVYYRNGAGQVALWNGSSFQRVGG